jgi:uncharacterized SAM-binding protein YcdF (DUF218 family)/glycosyltransferase involved in cell wall biosynthesis
MLRGANILCVSSIDWDFIWQGHQQIMATLAAAGNQVLFVENTGVRPPRPRDLPRLRRRLVNWWRGVRGFRQERENLVVYSPLLVPLPYSRVARWLNRIVLTRALRRWIWTTGFHRPILWTFLPTPIVHDLAVALDVEMIVYYCIDDLASSSPAARRITRSEEKLFRSADLVFVTSEKLRTRAASYSERVHLFPFGVDYATFARARDAADPAPPELAALPRPIVGYIGGLHHWIDQPLLGEVADRMPEASFVLVGPVQTDVSALVRRPNVHVIGARPHGDLPRYIKAFDVGLVPYRLTDYTANVYPTKLNEYHALGTPVVATDLTEIRRFNAEHGSIVATASDAAGFVDAIRKAIVQDDAGVRQRRAEVAQQNGWDARIEQMSALVETRRAAQTARRRWEDRLLHLARRARRRGVTVAALILAAWLFVFETPLVWWLAEPLRLPDASGTADAIVVFAGGVGESGKAGGGYQERVKRAVDLHREGRAQNIVFSSGYMFALREADVMRDLAVALGAPPGAILLEERAANTYENVRFTGGILQARGWRTVLLVTSPYHMRRAMLTARRVAPEVTVLPSAVPAAAFYTHGRGASLEQVGAIVHEYVAIVVYWWRGWI